MNGTTMSATRLSGKRGNGRSGVMARGCRLTDNGRPVLQSILFHKTTVIQTEIVVQQILKPAMTPQSLSAKTTGVRLRRSLPSANFPRFKMPFGSRARFQRNCLRVAPGRKADTAPPCRTTESGAPSTVSARTGDFQRILPRRCSALRGQCADAPRGAARRVWWLTACKKLNITFAGHARSRRRQGH